MYHRLVLIANCLIIAVLSATSTYAEDQEAPVRQNEEIIDSPDNPLDILFIQQQVDDTPNQFFSDFMHMMLMLTLILLVMVGVAWFLRRYMNARLMQVNVTSDIKITERRVLGPKSALYLVEIDGTKLLIGETGYGLVRLGQFETSAQGAKAQGRSFEQVLDDTTSNEI